MTGSAAHLHLARIDVDDQLLGAAHARPTHAAGHHRGVRGLAAPAGQRAPGRRHAGQVVGVRLLADQDDVLTPAPPVHGGLGVEHDPAHRGPGRRTDAGGEALVLSLVVEPREHQPRELGAGHPAKGLVEVDQPLADHGVGHAERRLGGALAHPGLQHPELAVLDGELDVTHVAVVVLQGLHEPDELVVRRGVELRELGERHRVPDAGHDVLALGVRQVVAVGAGLARRRVPGEADAGARRRPAVPEDHRLHVHRGADVVGDVFLAPVEHRPRGVPGVEHRAHGQVELLARVLREVPARVLTHQLLVRRHQVAQVIDIEGRVVLAGPVGLHPAQLRGEHCPVDAEHGAAEHLDQPPVGVVREPFAAVPAQTDHRLVVQAHVEDGLHHSRASRSRLRSGPRRAAGLPGRRAGDPSGPRAGSGARSARTRAPRASYRRSDRRGTPRW